MSSAYWNVQCTYTGATYDQDLCKNVWSKESVFSATITENGGILFYQDWISVIKYD